MAKSRTHVTTRERRNRAEKRNAEGEKTAQGIHAANPRSARPYRAYLAEKAKPKGERSAERMVTLRLRFTPTPKKKRPAKRHARGGRGRGGRHRGPPRRSRPARR